MTNYGDYQNRFQRPSNDPNQNFNLGKNSKLTKPEEISLKILSQKPDSATSTQLLEKNRIAMNAKNTNGNSASATKAGLVGPQILNGKQKQHNFEEAQHDVPQNSSKAEEHENHPKSDRTSTNEGKEVKQFDENITEIEKKMSDQIKSMSLEDLKDAMLNPEYQNHLDEIIARLEKELESETQTIAEETKKESEATKKESEEAKKESEATKKESEATKKESEETKIESEAIKREFKATEAKKMFSLSSLMPQKELKIDEKNTFFRVGDKVVAATDITDFTNVNQKDSIIYNSRTRKYIATSKENSELIRAGELKFKTANNEYEFATHRSREATNREREAIEDAIGNRYGITITSTSFTEESIKDREKIQKERQGTVFTQKEQAGSELFRNRGMSSNNTVQSNLDRQDKIKSNSETTPSFLLPPEYIKKTQELKRKKNEIIKHEQMVEDVNKNRQKMNLETTSIKTENFQKESVKLEDDFKEKILIDYVKALNKTDQPDALRQLFKESIVDFQRFDKIIMKSNEYPPELVRDAIAYKTDVFNILQNLLRATGSLTNARKGQDGRSR